MLHQSKIQDSLVCIFNILDYYSFIQQTTNNYVLYILPSCCKMEDAIIQPLELDKLLISVKVVDINRGADAFLVTNISDVSKDVPLGNAGAGILVTEGEGFS